MNVSFKSFTFTSSKHDGDHRVYTGNSKITGSSWNTNRQGHVVVSWSLDQTVTIIDAVVSVVAVAAVNIVASSSRTTDTICVRRATLMKIIRSMYSLPWPENSHVDSQTIRALVYINLKCMGGVVTRRVWVGVKVVDTSVTSQLNPLADSGHRRHTSLNVVIGIRRHTFGIDSWLGQARGEVR